ncbi:MAG TPA: hypothetical protein V6C88_16975 [Chroococcidiopsis sp.]
MIEDQMGVSYRGSLLLGAPLPGSHRLEAHYLKTYLENHCWIATALLDVTNMSPTGLVVQAIAPINDET